MRFRLRLCRATGLATSLAVIFVAGCSAPPITPPPPLEVTRVVQVTRIVQAPPLEVTRIVQAPPIEVTRLVPVAPVVEVTRLVPSQPVEVTRLVQVTRLVPVAPVIEVTRLVVIQSSALAATQPPAPTAAPVATAPPALPAVPIATPSGPTAVPPASDALLVWYDFEDAFLTSRTITDRSGHGYDAQISGEVGVAEGVAGGQAISFPGNGYVLAQGNPVAGRNTFSLALWFKTDHPENNYRLASAAWWNGGPASGWLLATHIPEFWSEDTRSLYMPDLINEDNHFPAGAWVYEVVTYDGNRIKEYTNGQLVNDWPATGAAIGQGRPMVVGGWPSYSAYNFQGCIDQFQVFSRDLAAYEVQALYNQR